MEWVAYHPSSLTSPSMTADNKWPGLVHIIVTPSPTQRFMSGVYLRKFWTESLES